MTNKVSKIPCLSSHIAIRKDGDRIYYVYHPLEVHLQDVAERTYSTLKNIGFNPSVCERGHTVGILHDLGKIFLDFQNKLCSKEGAPLGGGIDRGCSENINHAFTGAHFGEEMGLISKEGALAIAGHHSSLKNNMPETFDVFVEREFKNYKTLDPTGNACKKIISDYINPMVKYKNNKELSPIETLFTYAALVSSDGLDAEAFATGLKERPDYDPSDPKKNRVASKVFLNGQSPVGDGTKTLFEEMRDRLLIYLAQLEGGAAPTLLNKRRKEIREAAQVAAINPPGFYKLSSITGTGKTLASLLFALEHAIHNKFERIIYCIPFTSITCQTADIFRNIFGDNHILEHHSAFEDKVDEEGERDEWKHKKRRIQESGWEPPLILTTNVRFFESIYCNRTRNIKRILNIPKSVVVLDEPQAIGRDYFKPCHVILDELKGITKNGAISVLYTTATMPNIEMALKKPGKDQWGDDFDPPDIFEVNHKFSEDVANFKRVSINRLAPCGSVFPDIENLSLVSENMAAVISYLASRERVMCVANTKKQAFLVAMELSRMGLDPILLSGGLIPKERKVVIDKIKSKLARGETCRVVATSIVEAGVDLDFPCVLRFMTGLDSLVQAAGRCNREGKLSGLGEFVVCDIEEDPISSKRRSDVQNEGYKKTKEIIANSKGRYLFGHIEEFYQNIYKEDNTDVFKILVAFEEKLFAMMADDFKLIKENISVILECPESLDLIQKIASAEPFSSERLELFKKLKDYTMSVTKWQLEELKKGGVISERGEENSLFVLAQRGYLPNFGIIFS
jgi:CRISPR-associated helicase Cas3/CRISPR-associated endonuclease Cas3-HD